MKVGNYVCKDIIIINKPYVYHILPNLEFIMIGNSIGVLTKY